MHEAAAAKRGGVAAAPASGWLGERSGAAGCCAGDALAGGEVGAWARPCDCGALLQVRL